MPAVDVRDAIYTLGGHSDSGLVGTVERFAADARSTEVLPHQIQPRRYHVAAARQGRIYLAGGALGQVESPSVSPASGLFEEFRPDTGELRRLPDLPVPVCRPGAAILNNRLYIVGGEEPSGRRTPAVQIFDFETETWSRGADMPVAREGHIFAHGGLLYAPGGYDGTWAIRDFQVYDPASDAWRSLPDLPVKASAFQGVVVDDSLYLFGDYDELDRTVVWDFEGKTWAASTSPIARAHAGAARLGTLSMCGRQRPSAALLPASSASPSPTWPTPPAATGSPPPRPPEPPPASSAPALPVPPPPRPIPASSPPNGNRPRTTTAAPPSPDNASNGNCRNGISCSPPTTTSSSIAPTTAPSSAPSPAPRRPPHRRRSPPRRCHPRPQRRLRNPLRPPHPL